MHQKVVVREGKKIRKKPMLEAILNIHGRKAAKGDVRSAALIINMAKAGLSRERVESDRFTAKVSHIRVACGRQAAMMRTL